MKNYKNDDNIDNDEVVGDDDDDRNFNITDTYNFV